MFAFIVFLALTASSAFAHSHLAKPLPTRRLDCRVGNGRPRDCPGPCPPLDTYGEPTGVSPNRPAEDWRRGEERTISWHRNNHGDGESGFVRFTLVPVDKMMDKSAHQKFTFQVSCWSSGIHRCHSRNDHVCGNDADGSAYKVPITVPTSYPDGVYVFGWAWYGGGDFKGDAFFGDYYSCSFIRIQGGSAVTASSRPVFIPGFNQEHSDGCLASTNRLGQCYREPCNAGKVRKMPPSGLPRDIRRRDIDGQNTPDSSTPVPHHPQQPDFQRPPRKRRFSFEIEGMQIIDVRGGRMRDVNRKFIRIRKSHYKGGFTLGLRVTGRVQMVRFNYKGRTQEEGLPPFVVNGDVGSRYSPLDCRQKEVFNIQATVYGMDGSEKSVSYRVKCI